MTPEWGNTILFRFSQQLPGLDLPRALLPDLQRYKDTVRCAELGAEVPGHRQKQRFCIENTLPTLILDCKKLQEYNLVSDQTW